MRVISSIIIVFFLLTVMKSVEVRSSLSFFGFVLETGKYFSGA